MEPEKKKKKKRNEQKAMNLSNDIYLPCFYLPLDIHEYSQNNIDSVIN